MPILSMMRVSGDADELAAAIREHLAPVAERLSAKHGGLMNLLVRTDEGLLMINLWESEEGRHAMAEEPEIQEAIRATGLPEPHFEAHEILGLSVGEGLAAHA